jgi:hypothetical protein
VKQTVLLAAHQLQLAVAVVVAHNIGTGADAAAAAAEQTAGAGVAGAAWHTGAGTDPTAGPDAGTCLADNGDEHEDAPGTDSTVTAGSTESMEMVRTPSSTSKPLTERYSILDGSQDGSLGEEVRSQGQQRGLQVYSVTAQTQEQSMSLQPGEPAAAGCPRHNARGERSCMAKIPRQNT